MKKGIKIICFTVLLGIITARVGAILNWKESTGIMRFYQYDKNSIDVAFYGSSRCFCTVNTAWLWDKYGMAAYNMGESGQNIGTTYYYMKETLKTQKPKVMAVEARFLTHTDKGFGNGNLYRNTLNMKWSQNSVDNIHYTVDLAEQSDEIKQFVFLKFPVFHSRYNEITEEDFQPVAVDESRYNGAWTCESYETPAACGVKDRKELTEDQIGWMDKMIALAKENEIDLIFWIAPYILQEENMMEFNAMKDYANEKGIPFLNFNEIYQEAGIDYGTDMRKENGAGSHLNNFGAKKVTEYLGEYIWKNYQLEDHRTDESYALYNQISENWRLEEKNYAITQEKDFETYKNLLEEEHYSYAVIDRKSGKVTSNGETKSDVWYLSDKVILKQKEDTIELYVDKKMQKMNKSDVTVLVVDKRSGELIEQADFVHKDGQLQKKIVK